MATFPGDMNIGWGFGLEPQESQPTDPLLAVSELEVRVAHLENETLPDDTVTQLEQRITDLEERLRSLTLVVNVHLNNLDIIMQERQMSVSDEEKD